MDRLVAHRLGPGVHAAQPRVKKLRQRLLPPVPTSCLYSLSDGVVPPQEATLDGDPARHENIRVLGSHTGLGFNPMVLAIVADRLALPEDGWRGRTGFVHQAVLADFPDLSTVDVYASGPPAMIAAVRESFLARGADPERLHSDSFDYAHETGHDG